MDKGDGRRPHTGGPVTEKGDGAILKPVTFYILISDGFLLQARHLDWTKVTVEGLTRGAWSPRKVTGFI